MAIKIGCTVNPMHNVVTDATIMAIIGKKGATNLTTLIGLLFHMLFSLSRIFLQNLFFFTLLDM